MVFKKGDSFASRAGDEDGDGGGRWRIDWIDYKNAKQNSNQNKAKSHTELDFAVYNYLYILLYILIFF